MSAGPPPLRYTGMRIKRLEDPRLLTGRGRYLDDLGLPRMLVASFVRSPYAHARIVRIDTAAARALPGIVAVVTADDLRAVTKPLAPRLDGRGFTPTAWPALADGVARFGGEAVAAVVATDPYVAADARELVTVEWEAKPVVASIDQALASNQILFQRRHRQGDVDGAFARAAIVLRQTFEHGRCAPSPLEPRGILADWDGDALTIWSANQAPSIMRTALADALGLPHAQVRIVSPDVGGGFGLKMQVFPEDVAVAALARRLGRPVKWLEERRENLAAASQARAQRTAVEIAAAADGTVLALRSRVMSDNGAYHAYPTTGVLEPLGTASIMPGPYRITAYEFEALALATNKPPLGAYRGVGMTMGAFVAERMLDLVAERLKLDPADVRRRNLIPREAYPFTSATGYTYDSGDYPKALEEALAAVEYDKLRREQEAARAEGRLVGIGIACYTEYTGMGSAGFRRRGAVEVPGIEAATVTVDADATVRCALSFPTQGQGHATTIAQIVADRLGLALEDVRLQRVDTAESPRGSGTFASRGTVAMLGTAAVAADRVGDKLRALAAHRLEAAAPDVELAGGRAFVRGFPDRSIALAEITRIAYSPPRGGLPDGLAPGLEATVYCDLPGPTFSGAVHVAVVEVDPGTGRVTVRRYALVEDCGRVINPLIVEGQIHGAVAQGIGEALLESVVYDDDGQLLTATLMDYALPRADDLPLLEIGHLETPSPITPGGVKGMGEGGTIGAPATIANAVADAVRHLGVQITTLPIRPESLLGRSVTGRERPT
ncbi:MAG: carbon monoxide dehydrogenase [Candidatus Rokuibacteriota bacterium]|nr:MAG: carbon monoxide dehydrogenase [Candidatus Rokubacteria bacterium]PYO12308.1 MAG: carbon monoxide dehydrogenase [Candidatus Rokubacteria bacterium]